MDMPKLEKARPLTGLLIGMPMERKLGECNPRVIMPFLNNVCTVCSVLPLLCYFIHRQLLMNDVKN